MAGLLRVYLGGLLMVACLALVFVLAALCHRAGWFREPETEPPAVPSREIPQQPPPDLFPDADGMPRTPAEAFLHRLAEAAMERTRHRVTYDPSYVRLDYPGGDVPDDRGVCADVVVRAYRAVGVDLQKEVHEDMRRHFSAYPRNWGLSRPDPNIDHRRVLNLRTFFSRRGESLPATAEPADYAPGDVVVWDLGQGLWHIGLVAEGRSADGRRPLVVQNIGRGPRAEDVLTAWPVAGHYRYVGPAPGTGAP
jgi:uncharacterized protein YijF (DUF1287 family)